jgi:hypothetical protein
MCPALDRPKLANIHRPNSNYSDNLRPIWFNFVPSDNRTTPQSVMGIPENG